MLCGITGDAMKKLAIIVGVAAAGTVGVLVQTLYAAGKADKGGFFGPGVLSADVNLVLQAVLVLGLTFGFYLARSGNIAAHRVNQTTWVLVNTVLVALIMAPSLGQVALNSTGDLADTRYWVTWLHASVATFAVVAGLWLVLQMNDILPRRLHITWWKNLMRLTLAAYWVVALRGLATYKFWYVG
jgi:hypothetical protein